MQNENASYFWYQFIHSMQVPFWKFLTVDLNFLRRYIEKRFRHSVSWVIACCTRKRWRRNVCACVCVCVLGNTIGSPWNVVYTKTILLREKINSVLVKDVVKLLVSRFYDSNGEIRILMMIAVIVFIRVFLFSSRMSN